MSTEPATGRHEVTVSELQERTAADGAPPLTATLTFLAVGAAFLAAGLVGGVSGLVVVGGWVLVASALSAFYTAGAMMLSQAAGGRVVLPLGARGAVADTPGTRVSEPIEYARGMPGAKIGQ